MKKLVVVLIVLGFLFVMRKASFAADSPQKSDVAADTTTVKNEAVDAGNKICPVMGGPVGISKVTYEYKGKIYHLCCTDCLEIFKKDPEKYAAIAEKEINAVNNEDNH